MIKIFELILSCVYENVLCILNSLEFNHKLVPITISSQEEELR